MYTPRFSVVVPTYKRPQTLRKTLESILLNTRTPDEVLVIDDDALPEDFLKEMEEAFAQKQIPFLYKKKDHTKIRRGLSESKNWAAQITQYDVICFLDDDVVLTPSYFEQLFAVWGKNWNDETLIGIGGCAVNHRGILPFEHVFRALFGLGGRYAWDINEIGFQVWDESVAQTQEAYYMHGCSSSYRRQLLLKIPFAVFAGGRTALEDVEHCLRAKHAGFHFLYAPDVQLLHNHEPIGRDGAYTSGLKESTNRKEIFYTHCSQDVRHKLWFVWANIGWILKKILAFKFREAGGMMAGLLTKK